MHQVPIETQVWGIGNGLINRPVIDQSIPETQLLLADKKYFCIPMLNPPDFNLFISSGFLWKEEGQGVLSE